MSKLSELTSSLQESAKQQVESSKEIAQTALNEHENSVRNALMKSKKRIENDIRAHNARSRQLLLGSWKLAGLTFLLLTLAAAGVMTYQGKMIGDRWQTIREQNSTITQLEKKTWGITLHEGKNGRFIILPEDQLINTDWSVGKRKAILLLDEE